MTRTVIVVGAGIGGLSCALALRQAGWNVRLFERAASPRELGFGLLVAPNAVRALSELGLGEVVVSRGFAPVVGEVRRMDGTFLRRIELPDAATLGGPMVVALRPALHGALLEAVGPDTIALGCEAAGFTAASGQVTLQLANGETAVGDVLVGADGVGSAIRHTLHPAEPPPRPANIVAVRGAVHGALHHLGGLSGVYYLGRGVEAFLVRASDTGIYWALSLANELVPRDMRDPEAVLAHMLPKFDATFRTVTGASGEMRCDELVDRDPLAVWGRGAVTLLGDAAHPVLPHTGQGAAQAIVDAVALARALRGDLEIERALRSYERDRQQKTAALLEQGRRTAHMMSTTNAAACYLRELMVRVIPITQGFKLFARLNRRAGTDVTRDAPG